MQTAPANWATIFAAPHKTEYKFIIGDKEYLGDRIRGIPSITKPLLEKPAIGRVCSATMSVTVQPYSDAPIPKAARVKAYCRLVTTDGNSSTDWVPQGCFYVTSRIARTTLNLSLRDDMIKAGQTYFDKAHWSEWPQQQSEVAADIASIMGVEIDSRTVLATGAAYQVPYLGSDVLMSEVLALIGASNGGNWIMTDAGKLRLIPLTSPKAVSAADADIGSNCKKYTEDGVAVKISRVTLADGTTGNTYTAGDDTGYELTFDHDNASQLLANNVLAVVNGAEYNPYNLQGAYLNPLVELGDTVSVTLADGSKTALLVGSIKLSCNVGYVASLQLDAEQDAEEEFPYQSAAELREKRTVRTNQAYYGATISKADGIIIRRIKNDTEEAKVTFNADEMAFYQGDTQVLFFDPVARIWKMSAAVQIDVEDEDGNITSLKALASGLASDVTDLQTGYSNLQQTAEGLTTTIQSINGKYIEIKQTVDGVTVTNEQGETLINGGSIYTDNLYLSRLFSKDSFDSYIQMLDNGLNFVLGQSETIGIGYYSADKPQPYMIFGAGSKPGSKAPGMVKKYADGIWIGDSADRDKSEITSGTGIFVNTSTQTIYKYTNGIGVALADTSNVTAVFG